jgi:hypothetical protein
MSKNGDGIMVNKLTLKGGDFKKDRAKKNSRFNYLYSNFCDRVIFKETIKTGSG